MEIKLHDAYELPRPPGETRFRSLRAEPWPDGRRVAVQVQLTPFQRRPNLHISISDAQGREVASLTAIQILQPDVGFTLHLRQADTHGQYTVAARIAYPDPDLNLGVVDQAETAFEIT